MTTSLLSASTLLVLDHRAPSAASAPAGSGPLRRAASASPSPGTVRDPPHDGGTRRNTDSAAPSPPSRPPAPPTSRRTARPEARHPLRPARLRSQGYGARSSVSRPVVRESWPIAPLIRGALSNQRSLGVRCR